MHHVTHQHLFKNENLFYQFSKDIDKDSIVYKWNSEDLINIAKGIRLNVEIKDRIYHFKTYKGIFYCKCIYAYVSVVAKQVIIHIYVYLHVQQKLTNERKGEKKKKTIGYIIVYCFLGNVCVKYLVEKGICEHVPEAIAVGNALIEEKIIRHVTNGHKFENGPYFYEFVDMHSFDLFHITEKNEPQQNSTPALVESKTGPAEEINDEKEFEMEIKKPKRASSGTSEEYLAESEEEDDGLIGQKYFNKILTKFEYTFVMFRFNPMTNFFKWQYIFLRNTRFLKFFH
ncbi:hypothetical protein RFI_26967 [Reticulomyxa filosa]|uniref:DEP domain-containing protein n=1 Tax=Reticulomyxa filosa TaxID=46433 RepID=X6MBK6_RETFI|nr:hypothetical protein RFI_26967 [Reticulomyxa filosa]|eukprot:ETO10410.1 hypothetical protein RFI_26967 [Reticulomyxa filosa]